MESGFEENVVCSAVNRGAYCGENGVSRSLESVALDLGVTPADCVARMSRIENRSEKASRVEMESQEGTESLDARRVKQSLCVLGSPHFAESPYWYEG